jgi:REP element-mobilizing transposase RayT
MYDAAIHHRRTIRAKGYDYSQDGAYFVTICAQNKQCLFGNIVAGEMELNEAGGMIRDQWVDLKNQFHNIETDEFIVMPNHFHGIIVICTVGAGLVSARPEFANMVQRVFVNTATCENSIMQNTNTRADTRPAPTDANEKTLGDIICAFKSLTANEYIRNVKSGKLPPFEKFVWQRNYYEHVIRDDDDLDRIREYIIDNPINWEIDELHDRASG